MFFPANNNINQTGDAERRVQILRLAVIICLLLIFIDGGSRNTTTSSVATSPQLIQKNSPLLRLNQTRGYVESLNMAMAQDEVSHALKYARNISGVYYGEWQRHLINGTHTSGNFLLQIKSSRLRNFNGLYFIYGVASFGNGILHPLQGLFSPSNGKILLLKTIHRSQRIFLRLPRKIAINQTDEMNRSLRYANDIIFGRDFSFGTSVYLIDQRFAAQALLWAMPLKGERAAPPFLVLGDDMLPESFKFLLSDDPPIDQLQSQLRDNITNAVSMKDIFFLTCQLHPNNKTSQSYVTSLRHGNILLAGSVDSVTSTNDSSTTFTAGAFVYSREALEYKAAMYAVVTIYFCFCEIVLLGLQLRFSQNNAATIKTSMLTMLNLAAVDSVLATAHMLVSGAIGRVLYSSLLVIISILKLLAFTMFELRLVLAIYKARYAQQLGQEGPIVQRRHLAVLNMRLLAFIASATVIFYYFLSYPIVIVFLFYSFWLPQIVFSAWNGTRRALHPYYVLGTSISRLFIPLYFCACPNNFLILLAKLSIHPEATKKMEQQGLSCSILIVIWLSFQVAIIFSQDKFGARFFVPSRFLPMRYDYFRPFSRREGNEGEDASLVGEIEGGQTRECVICYSDIDFSGCREEYMLAPCNHAFHTSCLQRWMEQKLECPVCRCALPPLDE